MDLFIYCSGVVKLWETFSRNSRGIKADARYSATNWRPASEVLRLRSAAKAEANFNQRKLLASRAFRSAEQDNQLTERHVRVTMKMMNNRMTVETA